METPLTTKTGLGKDMVGVIHFKNIKSYAKDLFVGKRFVLYSLFYSDKYFVREYDLRIWQRLFIMADEPRSCRFAYFWNIIIIMVTITSSVIYMAASLQQFKTAPSTCDFPVCSYDSKLCPNSIMCEPDTPPSLDIIETTCVIIFSIDYFLRVLTSATVPARIAGMVFDDFTEKDLTELNLQFLEKKKIKEFDHSYPWYSQMFMYAVKPLNLIDLIAILPYYISLNGQIITKRNNFTVLRIFRLGRVFRLIKVVKNTVGVQLISRTLFRAIDALGILIFLSGIGVVVFASLMQFIEEGRYSVDSVVPQGAYVRNDKFGNEEKNPFESIPISIYYAVVTMCTVGYGDIVPTTEGGRLLACLFMYCGVLIFALPISVLGNNFDRLCDETRGGAAELLSAAICEILDTDNLDEDYSNVTGKLLDIYKKSSSDHPMENIIEDLCSELAPLQVQVLSHIATQQARKLCAVAILSKGLMDPDSVNSKKLNIYLEELGLEKVIEAIENPKYPWEQNVRSLFFSVKLIDDRNAIEALGEVHAEIPSDADKTDTRNHLIQLYHKVKPKLSTKEKIVRKGVRAKRNSIGLNAFGRITSDDEEITSDMINPNEKLIKPSRI